jgi:hypothetical protein
MEQKNNTVITPSQHTRLPILFRSIRRIVLFLFLQLCATLLFYAIGNSQNFLDQDIHLIVTIIVIVAISLFLFSLIALTATIYYLIKLKNVRYLLSLFLFLLTLISGIIIAIAGRTVTLLSAGFP